MESVPDWSGLVGDLLEQIAIRLVIIEDFRAFRGVCTCWRAAVAEDRYLNGGSEIPMILLPEQNGERELYSLWERRVYAKVALPQAKGKRCFDVGFGWILTIAFPDGDFEMFKPLSRAKAIQLPNVFKTFVKLDVIKQVVLSDDPSSNNNAVLTMTTGYVFLSFLVRNGECKMNFYPYTFPSTCCCYEDTIYALEAKDRIWGWDPSGESLTLIVQVDKNILSVDSDYLVKSTACDLLLISRDDKSRKFAVIRIDVAKRGWEVTNDLRGDAIFLSDNLPISVAAADFPGVLKPNCIYFTNDFAANPNSWPKDMGIYNVRDQSLEAFNFESSYGLSSPPLWISPSGQCAISNASFHQRPVSGGDSKVSFATTKRQIEEIRRKKEKSSEGEKERRRRKRKKTGQENEEEKNLGRRNLKTNKPFPFLFCFVLFCFALFCFEDILSWSWEMPMNDYRGINIQFN